MTRRVLVPVVALGGLGLALAGSLAGCDPIGRQAVRKGPARPETTAYDEIYKIDPETAKSIFRPSPRRGAMLTSEEAENVEDAERSSIFRPTRRRGALSREAAEIESHFNIGP